ncbi:hypothetical protein FOA43_000302 [Brettanomyces nanus]|uniref:C2H2-type domain-containing protein n=1 Tax=Eeniella nana TaxID=13502 RepID=A0A875RWT8_EENNA|nr:uncharacterized protein FOA43_000302 [Brettanomyces nanus]QPG72998.1 hypothetical protein FOA43_000302 [Brettanomyces nanus]
MLIELDLIESSITKRIRRNPDIYIPSITSKDHGILGRKKRISPSETLLQQHEIKHFIDRYKIQVKKLSKLSSEMDADLTDELKVMKSEEAFEIFVKLYKKSIEEDKNQAFLKTKKDWQIYDMFSSNDDYLELRQRFDGQKTNDKEISKKKRHLYRVLSEFCKDMTLSSIFSRTEEFGKYLDLHTQYKKWLVLPRIKPINTDKIPGYLEYLGEITKFDDDLFNKSDQYYEYLMDLSAYIERYWIKINPLMRPERSLVSIKNRFTEMHFKEPREQGIYCMACKKTFAKDTVYNSHLNGKKHRKSVTENRRGEVLKLEYFIKEVLTTLLADQMSKTQSETERFNLLTVRERQMELTKIQDISLYEIDYFATDSDDDVVGADAEAYGSNANGNIEDDEDGHGQNYNPLNLPLGPDGSPIPYWLWKASGLGLEFGCEVCGNIEYHGRRAFSNHFSEPRHVNGLQMLGVTEDFSLYKDLNKIDDVLKLLGNLQKRQREIIHLKESGEEVEDEDGNALSKKAYQQLKKQGLL